MYNKRKGTYMKIKLPTDNLTLKMLEENVTRSNPWKGEFSPSTLVDATCPRKFLWSKIFGLQVIGSSTALVYGSAIHRGVETFYKLRSSVAWEGAAKQGVLAFCEYWQNSGITGDIKRNGAGGVKTLGEYFKTYRNDIAEFVPGLVEVDQWIDMPNDTHLLVKIDRVRQDNGYYTICDTKTSTSSLTDWYFQQYETCIKVSLYFYTVMQILGQCDSIQIDGIHVPYPESSSTVVPFVRRNFMRTEEQIQDAVNTYCRITDYLIAGIQTCNTVEEYIKYFYCNQKNCPDYGGCPYRDMCTYHFCAPSLQYNVMATNDNGKKILELVEKEDYEGIKKLEITQQD